MPANSIIDDVTTSFRLWVQTAQSDEISTACLADFIRAWAWSGEGVRVCHGDYPTFLVAVIAIIDDWHNDEDLLNYRDRSDPEKTGMTERRTSKIFDPEDDLYYDVILDPHWFASCTFRTLHPHLTRK